MEQHGLAIDGGVETAVRDIVVVGGSAGALESLHSVLAGLDPELPAAVFVVVHTLPDARFWLPVIHVAPPDFHLLLEEGRMHLRRGPREHRTRPAIDPLFRSAAVSYGPRVIGILLSGNGGDGTSGMRAIKACGGIGLVELPDRADSPELPYSGLELGGADSAVPLEQLGEHINRLVREPPGAPAEVPWSLMLDVQQALLEPSPGREDSGTLGPPVLSCPECAGPVREEWQGGRLRYRCLVGHELDAEQLEERLSLSAHRALWIAVRTHEEHAVLAERLALRERLAGRDRQAAAWSDRARESREHAQSILALLKPGAASA